MRFLLNDNIPLSVKDWLRKRCINTLKAIEVGLKGAENEKIYRYAIENDFKIITLNLDFGYLFLRYKR